MDCYKRHGPYLYAYWKENKKLKKRYIGKSLEDYYAKQLYHTDRDFTYTTLKKAEFIMEQAKKGNALAQEYEMKLKENKVTIDWAYKQVINEIAAIELFKQLKKEKEDKLHKLEV